MADRKLKTQHRPNLDALDQRAVPATLGQVLLAAQLADIITQATPQNQLTNTSLLTQNRQDTLNSRLSGVLDLDTTVQDFNPNSTIANLARSTNALNSALARSNLNVGGVVGDADTFQRANGFFPSGFFGVGPGTTATNIGASGLIGSRFGTVGAGTAGGFGGIGTGGAVNNGNNGTLSNAPSRLAEITNRLGSITGRLTEITGPSSGPRSSAIPGLLGIGNEPGTFGARSPFIPGATSLGLPIGTVNNLGRAAFPTLSTVTFPALGGAAIPSNTALSTVIDTGFGLTPGLVTSVNTANLGTVSGGLLVL